MLSKFRVKNFKSFMNDTTIELDKTNYRILESTNVGNNDILKGALFVGGNATGKTNLILALKLLLEALFSDRFNLMISNKCFFAEDNNMMELEYEFIIEGSTINYLIEYDFGKKMLIEKLKFNGDLIIDRQGSTAKSEITDNRIFEDLREQHLLVRYIFFNTGFSGKPTLQKWFDFLANSIYINPYKNTMVAAEGNSDSLLEYLDRNDVDEINHFFDFVGIEQKIEYTESASGGNISVRSEDNEKYIIFRRNYLEAPIPFDLESLGNQNLVKMLPHYLNVLKNGGMLIIDEFSSGFHNELEELLIKYFMENSKNSQLFVVSHSTNLLSNFIFRPDQIYTVDFDGKEGSRIKRVSNEKPREAQNIEKMYLNGKFGGVPRYNDDL